MRHILLYAWIFCTPLTIAVFPYDTKTTAVSFSFCNLAPKTCKNLYIISGCNGAGKTTASYTVLPEFGKACIFRVHICQSMHEKIPVKNR